MNIKHALDKKSSILAITIIKIISFVVTSVTPPSATSATLSCILLHTFRIRRLPACLQQSNPDGIRHRRRGGRKAHSLSNVTEEDFRWRRWPQREMSLPSIKQISLL